MIYRHLEYQRRNVRGVFLTSYFKIGPFQLTDLKCSGLFMILISPGVLMDDEILELIDVVDSVEFHSLLHGWYTHLSTRG